MMRFLWTQAMHPLIELLKDQAGTIFGNYPVLFAYVYGSVAEGTHHKYSDLDIAVYVEPPVSTRDGLNLELSLALDVDEALGHRIESDVRIINHLPLVLKGGILTDGFLIYCLRDDVRIDFEAQVRKEYFDFLPVLTHYRQMYRESMINSLPQGPDQVPEWSQ